MSNPTAREDFPDNDQRFAVCQGQWSAANIGGNQVHQFIALTAETVNNYNFRFEDHGGRQHIVVPAIILVEGVHNGSAGPLYYPAEELSRVPSTWNGVPVTVNHPETDGTLTSANDPEVMKNWAIGVLFNATYDEAVRGIRVELWIDVGRCQRLSPETLANIRNREPVEVSTGLWFDLVSPPGVWNGEDHIGTVANMIPDHLAILPEMVGACSLEDGCGIRANKNCHRTESAVAGCECGEKEKQSAEPDTQQTEGGDEVDDTVVEKVSKNVVMSIINGLKGLVSSESADDDIGVPDGVKVIMNLGAQIPKQEILKALVLTGNQVGAVEILNTLQGLADAFDERTPTSMRFNFVEEVFSDGSFIMRVMTHLENGPSTVEFFKGSFETDSEGVPTSINAEMVRVRERREFVEMEEEDPVQGNAESEGTEETDETNTQEEDDQMNKEEVVNSIIACERNGFGENDRDSLLAMEEDVLTKMAPAASNQDDAPGDASDEGEGEGEGAGNEEEGGSPDEGEGAGEGGEPGDEPGDEASEGEGKDTGDAAAEGGDEVSGNEDEDEGSADVVAFLEGQDAPPEMIETTKESLRVLKEEKDGIVKTILEHAANTYTEQQLRDKDIFDLRSISSLMGGNKEEEESPQPGSKGKVVRIGATGNISRDKVIMAKGDASKPMGRKFLSRSKKK
jgi:hypothetical protein